MSKDNELITQEIREKMTPHLKEAGSKNRETALAAQNAFAAALSEPLRQGILYGDIIGDIFVSEVFDPNARVEYPIDFYRPDNASEFTAFAVPNQGRIPERHVEGDYVHVPTYDIAAGIDMLLRYAREARWDVVSRAIEVLQNGFLKKMNDDGWHVLLAAGFDRGLVVSDTNAGAGEFTKRLISNMKVVMRRNAGGNSTSLNRGKMTHLFISPEAIEDIRNWGVDQVDEVTRRELYVTNEGSFPRIFDTTLVSLDEFGDNQEYQDYYETVTANGAANNGLASASDVELVVGLDLSKNDSFVMPIREELEVHADPELHRQRRMGYYAWASMGFACLNNARVLLGSL